MNRNVLLIACLVVGLGMLALLLVGNRPVTRQAPLPSAKIVSETTTVAAPAKANPLPANPRAVVENSVLEVRSPGPAGSGVKTQVVAQVKKTPTKKLVQDPISRDALKLVGMDAEAELYWFAAIHDETLPKSERQDLIDDLNEEGLPDPKHPTPDDLPLLLSRLEILEELVPTLGGDLEWQESYNDLVNLVALATGRGKPVN
jgi:hypothetical protein